MFPKFLDYTFAPMNEDQKRILQKARDLYMRYGVKSITMDDVARELGISKKTLYQFVSDKDDLVGKFIDFEIEKRQTQICDCFKQSLNAIDGIFEISFYMIKMMKEENPSTEYDLKKYHPTQYQKLLNARREGMYKYILLNLKQGKEEGLYRQDMKEELIAKLYLTRAENIHFTDLFTPEELTSKDLFIELLSYHIRGIASDKGIKVLENKIKELNSSNS